jgi:hypothetical protein
MLILRENKINEIRQRERKADQQVAMPMEVESDL